MTIDFNAFSVLPNELKKVILYSTRLHPIIKELKLKYNHFCYYLLKINLLLLLLKLDSSNVTNIPTFQLHDVHYKIHLSCNFPIPINKFTLFL